jgi:6,7-dimethyl-8-ribityllumazine synthase
VVTASAIVFMAVRGVGEKRRPLTPTSIDHMTGSAPRPRRPPPRRSVRGRFAIVAARFNEPIVMRLVEGARHAFAEAKIPAALVELHWVPGSFELPLAALHLAATKRYAAIVCVGVVIRGETPHFEHVAREAAAGIRQVALTTGVPATFGVITTNTEEQAWARAGGKVANRGEEAATAALEMAGFVRRITAGKGGTGGSA